MTINCDMCKKFLGESVLVDNVEYKEHSPEHIFFCSSACYTLYFSRPMRITSHIIFLKDNTEELNNKIKELEEKLNAANKKIYNL